MSNATESKCPFGLSAGGGTKNQDWCPNQLRLDLLHQHSAKSNPMGEGFDYRKEFQSLGLTALKKDLAALMTDSQVVASGLRSLRAAICSHGMAQRGHVSHRRRARRRRQKTFAKPSHAWR
jgi:hypothetical protein